MSQNSTAVGAGLLGLTALVLAACAAPKPFDTGEVAEGHIVCDQYEKLRGADPANPPEGCRDASGLPYEVVVSSQAYTIVDVRFPDEDEPFRGYTLRRGL